MNIIKRLTLFIKSIFNKKEIKKLEPSLSIDKKKEFAQSLRVINLKKKSKIETLVCVGSGLGIQGKISY